MAFNIMLVLFLLSAVSSQELKETAIIKSNSELVNNTFVLDIIRSVHAKFEFENFVFYISERIDIKSANFLDFFQKFCIEFSDVPITIIANNDNGSYRMYDFLSAPSMCFVFTTDVDDPVMKLAENSLEGVRMLHTIFILMPVLPTKTLHKSGYNVSKFSKLIHKTYAWIWKRQFLNTILVTIRNNVFILDPYPNPTVLNKTDKWNLSDFFIDYSVDFKGYVVDTPLLYDIPRAFPIYFGNNTRKVSGTSGLLFAAFIESINATYNDTSDTKMNAKGFCLQSHIDSIGNKTMEISLHSLTFMSELSIGYSYPININDWCIMVPFQNRSPDHLFIQRSLQNSTWILMMFSILYISISIWICMPGNSRDLSASFLQAVSSLLYIAPMSIIRGTNKRIRTLYFLLLLLGFILSNVFLSRLASFLTSSPQQKQINTIDDVVNENLKIMVLEFEYGMILELPQSTKKFIDLLQVVDKFVMSKYRDNFNTSYGYSVATDRWNFINKQQSLLRKPLFRLSHICMGPFFHVFPMQNDSHLRDPLQRFLMTANQAGLIDVFAQRTFEDALRLKYVRMMIVLEEPMPLSLRFFRPIWLVWTRGIIVAVVTFVLEMKWSVLVLLCRKIINIWK